VFSLWVLDIRRAVYLLWVTVRFGTTPLIRFLTGRRVDPSDAGVRLRRACETLGLTYMKLGQYLASRIDLLPEEVCGELTKLFEQASPVEFAQIRAVVESDLQRPLEEAFSEFRQQPVATASVAQVHEAYTLSGRHVAVKVQRPGVARLFRADIRNLRRFAAIVDALVPVTISLRDVVSEFARWTTGELDFTLEGRTADALRRDSPPFGTVPRIYWDLTTPRVLTMEFIEGISLARMFDLIESGKEAELEKMYPGLDLGWAAENLIYIVMHQLFVTGFFHGDPHPGNIFVRSDNSIVLLDCGIFGELQDQQREYLAAHIENLALGDIDASFHYYAKQLTVTEETDEYAFERDGKAVLSRWRHSAMSPYASREDRQTGKYGGEMLRVVKRHHVRMSTDTLLFWRALEALSATANRLSGHFDLFDSMRAFFQQVPSSPAGHLSQTLTDRNLWWNTARLAQEVPGYASQILASLTSEAPAGFRETEALNLRRSQDRRTKLVGLAVLVLTVALLHISAPAAGPSRVPVLAISAAAFVIVAGMVFELLRRNK
jgi:ubiquinone biosynthesis protein